MIKSIATSFLLVLAAQTAVAEAMTAADVKRCNAMAATMAPKKAEIETLQTKRDEMSARVELKGEAWEDAEIHRLVSAAHAAKAMWIVLLSQSAGIAPDTAAAAVQARANANTIQLWAKLLTTQAALCVRPAETRRSIQ